MARKIADLCGSGSLAGDRMIVLQRAPLTFEFGFEMNPLNWGNDV